MTRTPHFVTLLRSDFILWGKTIDKLELQRDHHIGKDIDDTLRQSILDIIHDNWNSFYERDVSRSMLDFEFYLYTGNSLPVCCRRPVYGFHDIKIMNTQIADLEANGLIIDCEGS